MKELASILTGKWVPNSEVDSLIIQVRKLLQGEGWAVICHGSSPRPTIPSAQDCMSMNIAPMVECQSRQVTIMADPHDLVQVYDFLWWKASDD